IDMKVEPFLISSTVSIILAQRLVRQICQSCKVELEISREDLEKSFPPEVIKKNWEQKAKYKVYKGTGCKLCRLSGYRGRLGLYEVLEVTKAVRKLINEKADADVIAQMAIKDGMRTILMDGFTKVAAGDTTLEEILRVTKAEYV
ncbi:MAG: type II/IV secretion system protein, partial [Candidatus Amesbacteria bacterium]|nr:type II/IV secretion system protein [Candidatus Amesbacteria bacterium]